MLAQYTAFRAEFQDLATMFTPGVFVADNNVSPAVQSALLFVTVCLKERVDAGPLKRWRDRQRMLRLRSLGVVNLEFHLVNVGVTSRLI